MRSTRNQPFCWQEKKIFRLLRKKYLGTELVKLRCLYGTITEIDSDFNSKDIKYYTKTIHTYSGLSKEWIPSGLKILQRLNIIKIIEDREKGKFKGKRIIFTPENIIEMPVKTVTGKAVNGESFNGKSDTSKDILNKEDSIIKEDTKNIPYLPLAELLYTEHKKHDKNFLAGKDIKKTLNAWANDIRLLVTIDKRDPDLVKTIITWCQGEGNFWVPNILSGFKLRQKFPVLYSQYKSDKKPVNRSSYDRAWKEKYGKSLKD